jgi:hypothetical protein
MLRSILNYLPLKAVGALDNACTNQRDRVNFLMALENFQFSVRHKFPERWCLLRGILIGSVSLIPPMDSCWPELIRRSQKRISTVSLFDLDVSCDQQFEMFAALGMCSNVSTLMLCRCHISDIQVFVEMHSNLQRLTLYWTSLSLLLIPAHCLMLQQLVIYHNIPCVSDQELRVVLEGCRYLKLFRVSEANFTDESIPLLIETKREKKIKVTWTCCPRVTWDQRLFYLREISLDQLFSEDVTQQTIAISEFTSMNLSDSQFPVEHYSSMNVFNRIYELLLKLTAEKKELVSSGRDLDLALEILTFLDLFLSLRHLNFLIQMRLVELVVILEFSRKERYDWSIWLSFLQNVSEYENGRHIEYLLSIGILSRLVIVGQVRFPIYHSSTSPFCHLSNLAGRRSRITCDSASVNHQVVDKHSFRRALGSYHSLSP